MIRGFIWGILVGLMAIVLGLGGLSLLYGPNRTGGAEMAAVPEASDGEQVEIESLPDPEPSTPSEVSTLEIAVAEPEPAPDPEPAAEPETKSEPSAAPEAPSQPEPVVELEPAPEPQSVSVSEPEPAPVPAQPAAPDVVAEAPASDMTVEVADTPPTTPKETDAAEPGAEAPVAPQPAATEPSVVAPAAVPETTLPEASEETAQPEVPATDDTAPQVAEVGIAPDLPGSAAVPDAPVEESAPEPEAVPDAPEIAGQDSSQPATPAQTEAPASDVTNSDAPPTRESAPGLSEQAGVETPPEADSAPDAPAPAETVEPEQPPSDEAGDETPDTEMAAAPSIKSEPIAPLTERSSSGSGSRLPTIGTARDDQALPGAFASGDAALTRNAQPFELAANQPVMSVVLVDMGAERSALGDLKNLPFPISFVVDASAADAAEALSYYRKAGAEVVLAVPLPKGVQPKDVDVTMQAYGPLLDQTVAVLIPASSGFQALGPSAAQVGVNLAESGHGLISIPHGLNTGHKSALKEGAAAGLVFRDLDSEGQNGGAIRRAMDNAAFKAGQEDGVILLGHARIDTVQALIEWSLGNRAKTVALAPVSVVLSGG